MSADTTSINDLPADPASGVSGNISLSVNEMKQTADPQSSPALALDQTTINQIVNGLQQASATGATQLMSRDIPQNTQGYTQDAQIQPTYIPQSSNVDYIKDYEDNADIIIQILWTNYTTNCKYPS